MFAQLSKNLENACIKARRYKLAATRLVIFLRNQDFTGSGVEIKLSRPTAYPVELFGPLRESFEQLYQPRTLYRQTGVVLAGLVAEAGVQYTLFDDTTKIEKMAKIYECVDELSESTANTPSSMRRACPRNCRPSTKENGATCRGERRICSREKKTAAAGAADAEHKGVTCG